MINGIKKDADERMQKSLDSLGVAFARIRTGRAHPDLLDTIHVKYYGNETPLKQVANITVEDNRTLAITPWEKNMVAEIEKAILKSDLGITPSTSGSIIRLTMRSLTEQTRKELTKVARHEAEGARVAVRNVRREANSDLKESLKEKEIAEDDERRAQDDVQKLTDKYIGRIDEALQRKEAELMVV